MSYESKRNNALKRGIEFTLTQHEYDILHAIGLHRESRCAYTGQPFIHKSNHKFSPTIERMEDRKGYIFENCIVVTKSYFRGVVNNIILWYNITQPTTL